MTLQNRRTGCRDCATDENLQHRPGQGRFRKHHGQNHQHFGPLSFPILIGDIGGTNARFSLLVDPYAEPREFPIVHTADFPTVDAAIQAGVMDKTSLQPRSAILAVAGPISRR
nr:glucokinase [Marinicella sp. W31]MDC2879234.1 glucokinase [Marinicella sp. W31]